MKLFTYLFVALSTLAIVYCANGDHRELEECKSVCDQDVLPKIDALVRNKDRSWADFSAILPHWENCKIKCTRCHLVKGVRAWAGIKLAFENGDPVYVHQAKGALASNFFAMIHSLKWNCYDPWERAMNNNDYATVFY